MQVKLIIKEVLKLMRSLLVVTIDIEQTLRSEAGRGTRFDVYLPVIAD